MIMGSEKKKMTDLAQMGQRGQDMYVKNQNGNGNAMSATSGECSVICCLGPDTKRKGSINNCREIGNNFQLKNWKYQYKVFKHS